MVESRCSEGPLCFVLKGKTIDTPKIDRGYVCLDRTWQPGDVVDLVLPMLVRRVAAHGNVKADNGRVALQRGPIVFCLEGQDNDAALDKIHLPEDSVLTARYREDLLGGVVVLEGKAIEHVGEGQSRPRDIKAIPYYSWNNRTVGKMITWLLRGE
jgi:DUF1680 family protein